MLNINNILKFSILKNVLTYVPYAGQFLSARQEAQVGSVGLNKRKVDMYFTHFRNAPKMAK